MIGIVQMVVIVGPGALLGVLGIVLVLAGAAALVRHRRRVSSWLRVPGEVYGSTTRGTSGNLPGSTSGDMAQEFVLLRYTGPDGVARTARNPVESGTFAHSFPFPVEVLVDPRDPGKIRIADSRHSGGAQGPALMILGAVLVIAALVLLVIRRG